MNPFVPEDRIIEVDRPTPCYWDPALWFSKAPDDIKEAKRLCGDCPVQKRCRSDSIEHQERFGTWGGLSAEERLALLPPEPEDSRRSKCRSGFTAGVGTLRRLRALAANGWTLAALAREGAGLSESALAALRRTRSAGTVTVTNAERVAALYDRLQGIEGPDSECATRSRNKGWEPPTAWIGRDIDEPEANNDNSIGA